MAERRPGPWAPGIPPRRVAPRSPARRSGRDRRSTRTSSATNPNSAVSHGAQVSRSATDGLFCGGAHRTAATMRAPEQPLPVPRRDAGRLGGQPGAPQRRVQHVAAAVAGKDPPGPVAAVRRRRQAHDQHPRPLRPPAGNRPPPVTLGRRTTAASRRDPLPPFDQPGAGAAHRLPRHELGQGPGRGGEPAHRGRVHPATGVADVAGSSGQPVPGGTGLAGCPAARRHRPVTSDQAMPSRMSCSLTTTSPKPNRGHDPVEHQCASADHVDPARVHHRDRGALLAGLAEQSLVTSWTWAAGITA